MAAKGQILLQVERKVLHPDRGLSPVLQEGELQNIRNGNFLIQSINQADKTKLDYFSSPSISYQMCQMFPS